jgi:hypothetical protein
MNLTRGLLQYNRFNKIQTLPPDKSLVQPCRDKIDLNTAKPRILFEAHPLTLKNGTGIHVYALNLLRGIDAKSGDSSGLLLLLNERFNIPLFGLNGSHSLKNLQKYAKLLGKLFQTRYPQIDRSNRSQNRGTNALKSLKIASDNIYSIISFFFVPEPFHSPAHSSLASQKFSTTALLAMIFSFPTSHI